MERFTKVAPGVTRCTYSPGDTVSKETCIVKKCRGVLVDAPPIPIRSVSFEPRQLFRRVLKGKPEFTVEKTADGQKTRIQNQEEVCEGSGWRAVIRIDLQPGEHIYGLGQDETGRLDKRGHLEYLYQHNMRIPMPMFVSSLGYAVLADCGCLMTFDSREDTALWTLECVRQVDLYVMEGSMDQIIAAFRDLTGRAAPMPDWALGYWQSKERYTNQEELLEVARRYREMKVPLDVVVQDWLTWEGELWGDKHLDKSRYPDVADMKRQMEEMHVHTVASIWPNVEQGGGDHGEFERKHMLLGNYSTYDAFDPKARWIYRKQMERDLTPGFDGWWCDSTEPFADVDWCGPRLRSEEERYRLVGGEHEAYLGPARASLYALSHARGIYENQPSGPVVNLTRSGWAGIQKYGVILWAGDTSASWAELRREIAKGLSMSLSGIPYWTVDAGAFFVKNRPELWFWSGEYENGVEDPAYQELYTRWLQFACFLPIFRSHGTDTPREVWNFREPYRQAIQDAIRLRYRLMPYIKDMARRVTEEHFTIMRSLMFDFPREERSAVADDEYMFGESILVCPVTEPMCRAATKKCWLPDGADWYDFWTDQFYQGGQTVEMKVELGRIPLFVRAGAALPVQEGLQYAAENRPATELHYPRNV